VAEDYFDRILRRLPLSREVLEAITARLIADTNAGVDPTDPTFADLVPRAILHDVFGAFGLELVRAYDRAHAEIPAKALPATSDGLWLDSWAETLGLERKDEVFATGTVSFTTPAGTAATDVATGTEVSTVQVSEDEPEIAFQTIEGGTIPAGGGTLDLDVQAIEAGAQGNVAVNTVTVLASPIAAVTITNPAAISGGADVETDEQLSRRVVARLASTGGQGNVADYENWCLAYPGVGFVTVQANWNGPGTVRCLITDVDNRPMGAPAIAGLQAQLDPVAGQGLGLAPIGAVVTVATPAIVNVTVAADVTYAPGYSLDGAGGTQAREDEIIDSLRRYVDRLPAGEDVMQSKVIAAIVDVPGVADVEPPTINGVANDLVIASAQIAAFNTANLT
jgi:uncharacterized phage protein gp47/JayE